MRGASSGSLQRVVGLVVLFLALPAPAAAATVPSGFAETRIVGDLNAPTTMTFAPDGRLFVSEQDGRLLVVKNGQRLAQPFVTLPVDPNGERGLLGIAFDPQFATNGYVYVYYTARTPNIHNRVSRFRAVGDVAQAGSEQVIFDLDPLSAARNHNGGAIHFGPDGKLYIAAGENARARNAEELTNVLGKILRVNPDGSIPTDNPFYSQTSGKNRAIWALGLRNPFTFSFQPGPGRMLINDVGQQSWEEVNEGIRGANYGWPMREGPSTGDGYTSPLFAYQHGQTATTGCAIAGGSFYNPATTQFPSSYVGDYFFADYCSGWIRKLDFPGNTASDFASGASGPVDVDVAPDGSVWYLTRGHPCACLYRISYTGSGTPTIGTHPASQTVSVGSSATFSVSASGSPPLSYQWQRNGINIAGATGTSYTLPSAQASDNGARFRVRVSNSGGSVTSNDAVLTVTSNQAPTATITTPAAGTLYSGGQTIAFSGSASDPEEGTLGGARFTWRVDFHHASHTHPHMPSTSGSTSGSFTAAATGHPESDVWYRIHLTVTDSGGLSTSTFRDVNPRLVTINLATSPSGLGLRLDGQPITTPHTFTGVVGVQRLIEAPSPQTSGTTTYTYQSWSNGGPQSQTITTPASNTTYTATYGGSTTPSFQANVNFQTASAPSVSGYFVDAGATYGARGNGHTYGWNVSTASSAFDRNSKMSPDQRYDTLINMQNWRHPNAAWEIAVPNGSYTVRIVAGDATSSNGVYRVAAEGTVVVDGTPNSSQRWVEGTRTVTVTDGRLTLTSGSGASNNKLCFVEIASA